MLSCLLRAGVLLAAIACFMPAPSASAAALARIGIADQKADMFADPRMDALGVKQVRRTVSWDALHQGWQRAEVDAWMRGAQRRHIDPLITFGHARGHNRRLPSPQRFRQEFRAFRARYPWATTFATWNEANLCGEGTCRRAKLVAAYYGALRRECPRCTILAAELLDLPSMARWIGQFRHALGYMPRLWGLHDYHEVNDFKTSNVDEMLRLIGRRGTLWLTETGGVVRRTNHRRTDAPQGTLHAARVTRFIFDDLVRHRPAIKRVYIYHWNAGPQSSTWDSALIGFGGIERGAYWVLWRLLRKE